MFPEGGVMGRLKKLKGGMDLYVTEDEKLLVNSNSRNGVYVYDTDTMKQVFQTKTVSYVAQKAVSPDKKLLAAKNTSGQMALISLETGEEICRCDMAGSEGYKFTFTPDSKAVLDFDWDGRTMLLNAKGAFKILDGPKPGEKKDMVYLHYDRFSGQIYKLATGKDGDRGHFAYTAPISSKKPDYRQIHKFTDMIPDHIMGISFCKDHIYFPDKKQTGIVETDKSFEKTRIIPIPKMLLKSDARICHVYVSPYEKYVFFYLGFSWGFMYDLTTMEPVMEFTEDVVSDFTMLHEDNTVVISTWGGTYVGDIT